MKREIIALLDGDGVLFDFHTAALNVITTVVGSPPSECYKSGAAFGELEPEEEERCWEATHREGWVYGLPVYPGAIAGVQALRQVVTQVVFVTAPLQGKTWHYERSMALMEHFGAERADICTFPKKELVFGHMMVEDRILPLRKWHARWKDHGAKPVLMEQPYNKIDQDHVHVARSWEDVLFVARFLSFAQPP